MFKPLHGRVIVRPDKQKQEEVTPHGIIIPNKKREKPVTGTVIVGGEVVKKGDNVIFSAFGYDEATLDGEMLYIVSEDLILAII